MMTYRLYADTCDVYVLKRLYFKKHKHRDILRYLTFTFGNVCILKRLYFRKSYILRRLTLSDVYFTS
jgi:hypothetical protein